MELKGYLKQICSLEQTVHETNLKISKHKSEREATEKRIKGQRAALESDVNGQQTAINSLTLQRKKRENFTIVGTGKQKKTIALVCVITAIFQAIFTAIPVALLGADNYNVISVAYTIMYAAVIGVALYLEYTVELKFPVWQTILGVIALAVLYQITHWYFKTCNNFGINVIAANIISTAIIIGVEILFGVGACKKEMEAQIRAYNANKKWLRNSVVELQKMQDELKLRKQNLVDFNTESAAALAKMDADIISMESFCRTTKKRLQDMYAQNVLHPNYQTWLAAATIYEYLDVGRCYQLKGPDGAYELYERELIAKKILNSLFDIKASINYQGSSISSSQMYIRRQLSESNRHLENIKINTYHF